MREKYFGEEFPDRRIKPLAAVLSALGVIAVLAIVFFVSRTIACAGGELGLFCSARVVVSDFECIEDEIYIHVVLQKRDAQAWADVAETNFGPIPLTDENDSVAHYRRYLEAECGIPYRLFSAKILVDGSYRFAENVPQDAICPCAPTVTPTATNTATPFVPDTETPTSTYTSTATPVSTSSPTPTATTTRIPPTVTQRPTKTATATRVWPTITPPPTSTFVPTPECVSPCECCIIEYVLLRDVNRLELGIRVTNLIAEGWIPWGDPVVEMVWSIEEEGLILWATEYFQAVVKCDRED